MDELQERARRVTAQELREKGDERRKRAVELHRCMLRERRLYNYQAADSLRERSRAADAFADAYYEAARALESPFPKKRTLEIAYRDGGSDA